ncbi:carbamoyltransferase HypF, partial [bacterium]|nr:carbamoyltransferase HypF [bacterium]
MNPSRRRVEARIQGAVQGVGYRPTLYRIAVELGLAGRVSNTAQGVILEIEGSDEQVEAMLRRMVEDAPPNAVIDHSSHRELSPTGESGFVIAPSGSGEKNTSILPDLAICGQCHRELFDPNDRRYRYPFINCTHCGPRFSIVRTLPYDRPNTTMAAFEMCPACREEYEDPLDRRFHAQPVACEECGPSVQLCDDTGGVLSEKDEAIHTAADAIRQGKIVALKGLGGFQLLVDATNETAVERLRQRKRRPSKPLAVMAGSLEQAKAYCSISEREEEILGSPAGPIVLLGKRTNLSDGV